MQARPLGLRAPGLFLALWVFGSPAGGFAQSAEISRYLAAAAGLYESLEYEKALEQLATAKKVPHGVDDDVLIGLYEGVIYADMGKADESTSAFRAALYLKDEAKLPVKVSPKVERDFETLRAAVQKELEPIKKKMREEEEARQKREQEELARKQREEEERRRREQQYRPTDRGVDPLETRKEARTLSPVPFVIGGVGVAAAVAGAIFGSQSGNEVDAARGSTYQREAQDHLARAGSSATTANALFVTAGVAAVGAVITFFALSGGDSAEPPAPKPDGSRVQEAGYRPADSDPVPASPGAAGW